METPRGRIERLMAEGRIPRMAVARAERLWHERLHAGVRMPNGETVQITLDDLYHLIVEPRLLRKPERIASLLAGVFEIREAREGRRRVLSRWEEEGQAICAYGIIGTDGRLWTAHLVSERDLQRYQRREVLQWRL